MTLRLRLVLALVALVAVGLAVFGVATYAAYSRAQRQRLDAQLRASEPFVTGQLYYQLPPGGGGPGGDDRGPDGPPGGGEAGAPVVPSGTYAELRSPDGAVAADPSRRVTLEAPTPVIVQGDQGHLRQAIANLVSNALAHTPPLTAIEVSAARNNGQATVAVRDHGPGLDDQALRHVFDRFWRADEARVGSGSGLGLSIVAAIAHEHGGDVRAANADGGGARFELSLPPS